MTETSSDRMTIELAGLLADAATLSRSGDRIAAIATLRMAVGMAPDDLTAHRRLAASCALAGDPDSARAEYARFIRRLEARGSVEAAILEHSYANALLAPALAPHPAPATPVRHHLTRDQSFALRRVAVAVVAIAATFGAMFAAGAQIFASGGPL